MLQRARFAKGWSLRQLSAKSGVSVGAIQRAEADGNSWGQTLFRLADTLDLDTDAVLDALSDAAEATA